MKQEQSIIIEREIEFSEEYGGQLTVEVPYDIDTLNKLIAISILPELIFVGAELSPNRLGRTWTVTAAVWDLIRREDARYMKFLSSASTAGFPIETTGKMGWLASLRGGATKQSTATMQKLNALAITLDYIDAEKLIQYESSGLDFLELDSGKQANKYDRIRRTTDHIAGLMNTLDNAVESGTIQGQRLVQMRGQEMELYPFGSSARPNTKFESYFFISRLTEAWGNDELDFEGVATGGGMGQDVSLERLYIDVNFDDTNMIDDKIYYDIVGWIDDEWKIVAQIPYDDITEHSLANGGAIFSSPQKLVMKGEVQEEATESLLGFLASKQSKYGVDKKELALLLQKSPKAGQIYTTKSGAFFAAKTIAGRLLWVDTAILLGSGLLSLAIPQIKPFSPIGEVITYAWDFVAKALDFSTEELIEAAADADLSSTWLLLISQLVNLDEIEIDFEPNFTTIQQDLNLDGRTVGVMLTRMVADSFILQQKDYSVTKLLQSLCITSLLVATFLYGWKYLRAGK